MTGTNFYCAGDQCRKTTHHVCVRMNEQTYFYCVTCGRRLELLPSRVPNRPDRKVG
ncbi:MAG: hypothetical protein ACRDH5_14090 [bacterium]